MSTYLAQLQAQAERTWRGMGRSLVEPEYNAYLHMYVAASLTITHGANRTRTLGEARELNTWIRHGYQHDPNLRRDTFKDLYNNALAIRLAEWFVANRADPRELPRLIASYVDRRRAIVSEDEGRIPADVVDNRLSLILGGDLLRIAAEAWRMAHSVSIEPDYYVPRLPGGAAHPFGDLFLGVGWQPVGSFTLPFPDDGSEAHLDHEILRKKASAVIDDAIQRGIAVSQFGSLGNIVGSALGNALGGTNSLTAIAASSVLGALGQNLAQAIAAGGLSRPFISGNGAVVESVLDDFGADFISSLRGAVVGTVSSLLAMELGKALGMKGFGAELLTTAGASIVSHAANNVLAGNALWSGLNERGLFVGIDRVTPAGGILPGAIGSFLGAKLGSLILAPSNSEGAILSSIGSSAGVWALTSGSSAIGIGSFAAAVGKLFGSLAGVGVPFVGSLTGFLIGSLVGQLFGRRKPRVPSASADIVLDTQSGYWSLGAVTVSDNGNRDFVVSMAESARDGANNIIDMILKSTRGSGLVASGAPRKKFGHAGATVYFDEFNGSGWTRKYSGSNPDVAVEKSVLSGIAATRIIGGDMLLKRAIYASAAADLSTLLGNIQTARDLQMYIENAKVINSLISSAPTSVFASGWAIALLRAEELKLNSYAPSDFFGGLRGFAQSFGFGGKGSFAYENIGVGFEGSALRIAARDGAPLFDLLAASNTVSDPSEAAKSVYIPGFGANVGYTPWQGSATAGNDIWVAAGAAGAVTMDDAANGGDDIFVGSASGDQLYGRAGYDWLDGGGGRDWIEGGDQDDVLLGGDDIDYLSGGGGDDYIAGGEGMDYVPQWYGGSGAGGLSGGAGNDTMVGGGGTDSLFGDEGDDMLIVDQDGGGTFDYFNGGPGWDTATFERFGHGVHADLKEGRGGGLSTSIYGDGWVSIENLTGTGLGDTLFGDENDNRLRGLAGNDYICGYEGNDIMEGGAGADIFEGGPGLNTLSYEHSPEGVYVSFEDSTALGGDAAGDRWWVVHNLIGSRFGDHLAGDANPNRLDGGGGDDHFYWTAGYDTIVGGDGFDTFDASAAGAALTVSSGTYASLAGSTSSLSSIERYVGTAFGDSLVGGAADEVFEGGGGNDWLSGGAGSDTYVFGSGEGSDTVAETVDGHNVIVLKEALNWRDLAILGAGGGTGASLTVSIRATGEHITVGANWSYATDGSGNHNHKIKTIDLAGAGGVEIGAIDWTPAGIESDAQTTTIHGAQSKADLIFAYGGDDWFSTAGYWGGHEISGNVVYAGAGQDSIYGSVGDDQYVFERGDGVDSIDDKGGADTIVMGPSVEPDDVIYEVVKKYAGADGGWVSDLVVAIRDPNNPDLPASQVADRIVVQNGGTIWHDLSTGVVKLNTIEHVRVGGQEIDLTRAGIAFTAAYYQSYGGGGSGSGGNVPPLAIDLDGDGIELRSVDGSRITTLDADGSLWRVGWIGPDDGFLAIDRNGDGAIDRLTEISFAQDLAGATTDLEGLAAYDSNRDGVLDAADQRWGELKVFRDRNQDGIGVGREVMSLAEAGIVSIGLKGAATGFALGESMDTTVLATTKIGWADPTRTGLGYDVALAVRQVRTDGGGQAMADSHARGNGREKADALEASLHGLQALTDAQVDSVRARPKREHGGSQEGLLGRIEIFVDGSSVGEDGLLRAAAGGALHAIAVAEAKASEAGRAADRFAASEWTAAPGAQRPQLDRQGEDFVAAAEPQPDPGSAAELARAIAHFEAEKRRQALEAEERTARDEGERGQPLRPVLPPSASGTERRAAIGGLPLVEGPGRTEATESANLKALATPLPARQLESLSAIARAEADAGEWPQRAAGLHLCLDFPGEPSAPEAESVDYSVRIEMANSRLVQALAAFGAPPAMMASRFDRVEHGGGGEDPWIGVDRLAPVRNLMHVV